MILMEQLLHFLRPLVAFFNLPPDNATGNQNSSTFTGKISIDANNDIEKIKLLRPGMNVDVDVHIK
jgi:membrane fusion protein (multidrug efflux system)